MKGAYGDERLSLLSKWYVLKSRIISRIDY